MTQDETSPVERWLCPVCVFIHGHEVFLEVRPGDRPEVWCPCPKCAVVGRRWDTVAEYQDWVTRNVQAIEDEGKELAAKQAAQQEEDGPDKAHQDLMDEMVDKRAWDVARQKRDGEWDEEKHSAWGRGGPRD